MVLKIGRDLKDEGLSDAQLIDYVSPFLVQRGMCLKKDSFVIQGSPVELVDITCDTPLSIEEFEYGKILEPASMAIGTMERAELMSWLFLNFFAEAMIRVVRKEDEIWLLESGMRSAFYRWIRRDE